VKAAIVVAMLLAAAPAGASDLFGGYSSLSSGGDQVAGAALAYRWRLGHTWRLVAEASGQSGLAQGDDLREIAVAAGPVWAPWPGHRLSPFAQVRAGAVTTRRQVEVFGVAVGKDGVCDGSCPSQTGLLAEGGVGLDVGLTRRLALRLPQVDYRWTSPEKEGDVRVSAGLVWRF
jgi:hypothetical protein